MGGQAELSSLPIRKYTKMGGGGGNKKRVTYQPREPAMGYPQAVFDWSRAPKRPNPIPLAPGSITRHFLGVKMANQIRNWRGTVATYGAVAFVGFCFLTDWRVVMEKLPLYGPMLDEEPPK